MVPLTPRLPHKLVAELEHLAAGDLSAAEICRRIGARADKLGVPRPSYETVRVVVRRARRRAQPSTAEVLTDIAFRVRPPEALLDHVSGVGVPKRK